MSLRRGVAGVLWILLSLVPMSAQTTEIKYDHSADFRGYKTYAWQERRLLTQQAKEVQQLIDKSLVDAFNAQLKAKGFTENPSAPDFYLTFTGGSTIADAGSGNPYVYVPSAHTSADLVAGGVQGAWTNTIPASAPNVWVSVRGMLVVDVTDVKTKAVVWSNTLHKKLKNPGRMPKDLDKVAAEIAGKALRGFPPGAYSK